MSEEAYVEMLRAELEDTFVKLGGHRVIAFIAEPVVGGTLGCGKFEMFLLITGHIADPPFP